MFQLRQLIILTEEVQALRSSPESRQISQLRQLLKVEWKAVSHKQCLYQENMNMDLHFMFHHSIYRHCWQEYIGAKMQINSIEYSISQVVCSVYPSSISSKRTWSGMHTVAFTKISHCHCFTWTSLCKEGHGHALAHVNAVLTNTCLSLLPGVS